jgi:hypothetical protein
VVELTGLSRTPASVTPTSGAPSDLRIGQRRHGGAIYQIDELLPQPGALNRGAEVAALSIAVIAVVASAAAGAQSWRGTRR